MFFTFAWSFVLRKSKNTVFWTKTVFKGWLLPTLFLILILVSTACGFRRKLLHKMACISTLLHSPKRSLEQSAEQSAVIVTAEQAEYYDY